mmetsp:Transcript_14727/g.21442  ORF Transcript_14727/g.21442 Transcript_14727/m.21442 type:complete len:83 (-) Transcript_14727:1306-1554(-)
MTLLMQQAVQVSSSFISIFRYTPVFFIYISIQTNVSFSITAQDTCTSKCLVLRDIFFFPALYLTNTAAAIHEFLFIAVDATN